MTLILTSTNYDKFEASLNLLKNSNMIKMVCIKGDSKIKGGQPYGLEETKKGCLNRILELNENDNYISIENGFVKEDGPNYDIAFISVKINDKKIEKWSESAIFLKNSIIPKLIEYFEQNTITRFEQYNVCKCLIDEIHSHFSTDILLGCVIN